MFAFDYGGTFSGIAAMITALVGLTVVWFKQNQTHDKVEEVYAQVNHVEAGLDPIGGEPQTLGQVVRDGFTRNDEVHDALTARLDNQTELIRAHSARLATQAADIDAMRKALEVRPEKRGR